MDADAALAQIDALVATHIGEHLNNLQATILREVWQGRKYSEIANTYGYTEGHVKDVSAELWKQLSQVLGEKVTKSSLRAIIERHAQSINNLLHLPAYGQAAQGVTQNPNFIGREDAIAHLSTLTQQGAKIILIQGQGGIGKTTLARRFLQQEFGAFLEFAIARETQNITSVESLVEERLHQLNEAVGREFGISLDRLKRKLQTTRIGILIDNLEPALDADGKFVVPHRRYVELLQTLADPTVQSLTLITSRDRLCESAVTVPHYLLPGLEEGTWLQYFQQRWIHPDRFTLRAIHKAYGGNAKAMEIVASAISQDFESDAAAYWQSYATDPLAHGDLADLVIGQFQRLQQLDSDAYSLLCRLGCYRYQDIPTVTVAGLLALLWDVPTAKHRRVIESLRNRSLIEHYRGEYWVHPVIRAEAITRLRNSFELEPANRAAAIFWTNSIATIATVEDALRCFEAYYHYVEIQDFEGAAEVILKRRDTKLPGVERLGRSFYKLGLLQQMLDAIHEIIPKVTSGYHLSGLYSILGVLYRLSGKIHLAVECHQKSGAIAVQEISQRDSCDRRDLIRLNLKNWEQHALLNIGICQLELWELDKARAVFEELHTHKREQLIREKIEDLYNPSVDVFSAFVYSCLGMPEQSYHHVLTFEQAMKQQPLLGTGHRLLLLGLTYKNLGERPKAFDRLQRAIDYGIEHHYPQVRANALSGLAELHRQRQDFETALQHHQDAIAILEKIGTCCNLAEAYFQFGLTHQIMHNPTQGQLCFERAILLFNQMTAPKQIEKVQQAVLA
jgi:tetratricopeptide (TPR) repeat protein